jgi:uncharacterized repeat protein (TIGR01451 family)
MIRRATLLAAVLVALASTSSDPLFAGDVSWTNAAGGPWSTPGNWSTNAVPGSSDRALIVLSGTYTVTLDVNPSVAAVVIGAGSGQQTLVGSGRTLTVTDSVAVAPSGVLDLSNSTVNGPVIDRALLVARRACTFSGSSSVESGATLRVLGASGGSATLTVGPLTNRGTIELTTADGNFQTRLSGAGPVTNAPGSSIHVLPGTGGERHLSVPTINQGTVTLDYPLYLDNAGLSQLNDVGGTIDASNADLVLTQNAGSSFTNQGTMTIGATRTFSVSAGAFSNSGTIAGAGTLTLNGVTVAGSVSPGSSVLLDLTNCTVNASVTNQGLLVLHGFNTFNGGLTNQAGATVRNFQGNTTLASAVSNHGTIELTSTVYAQSNLIGNGTLTNEADGQIHVLVGGGGGERHLAVPTTNRGTVSVQNNLYLDNSGSQLNDVGGTYDVSGADLVVTQTGGSPSFNNQGTISIGSGRTCSISGGTFTNTGTLSGAGSLSLASLTANLNTLLTLNLTAASATTATLNAPQGLINGAGTTLTLNSVTMNGALTNQGVLVTRRTTTLNAALTNETGSTLRVLGASGGSANLVMGALTNRGAIELTTADGNFQSTLSGNGPLTNMAGSTFRVLLGTGGERHLQTPMVNQGTMTVEHTLYLDNGTKSQLNDVGGAINLTASDVVLSQSGAGSFTNRGTLSVGAGRIFAISGGTFLNDVAGTLRGSGTISSSGPDITNAGTISPGASPGKLSFSGRVVQSSTGRVRIELTGTQPISEYDVLSCSGQMVLGGTLQIAVLGGFVPPAGSAYVAIKYGTHTGTFSALDGANLGGGLQFAPTYTDTAIILSTGPLAITSVTSNHGGNSGVVSTVVHGVGFFPGLSARLSRGASQIQGQIIDVSPLATAFAVAFDLTGAALGTWDLVVQGSNGSSVMLGDAFTVEEAIAPRISVQIVGRPRIRIGQPASYDILVTNEGNVDALGVPVSIGGIPAGIHWSLGPITPPTTVPEGRPIDYTYVPMAYGTAAGDSVVPVLIPRMPPGITEDIRLTVTPTSSSPISLAAWTNPTWFSAGSSPSPLEASSRRPYSIASDNPELDSCLLGIIGASFDCAVTFIPGANCAADIEATVVSTAFSATEVIHGFFAHPDDHNGNHDSVVFFFMGAAWGALGLLQDCALSENPLYKIIEAFQCGYGLGSAGVDCAKAFHHDGDASENVNPVSSFDPNDKAGPSGTGLQRFVRGDQTMPYAIYFENLASATAPAAEVVVVDTLDATKVDVATVALGPIRFGSHVFTPPPGSSSYLESLDLRPSTNLVVRADVRLDTGTGVLTWRLSSIDPDTGVPPTDPSAGFLPPNITAPQGEGSVQYTVMARSDVPTGGVIGNRASIVFDTNEAILTPVWTNAIDATAPVSTVDALPAVTNSTNIPVTWAGSDAGSGVRDFTIHVSVDGGPDSVWLDRVSVTSATFTGSPGHSYAFYSVARDSVFLAEAAPAQPDAQTTISPAVGVGERAFVFALRGARPNPADSRVLVSFELPMTMPGALDLFDLAGRSVAHHEIGGLEPGVHSVSLGQGERIRPGMYFVRLQQGVRTAVKKVVVSE